MSKDLTNSASVAQIDKRPCFSIPARPLSVDVGILDLEPETEILITTSLAGFSGRTACKAKDAIEEIERTIKRQGMDHYTMREIAEIMAAAHNLDACDFLKTRMQPAFESGALKLIDPKDGGLVKERQCRKHYDWVTPANLDKWLETELEYRWPVEVPVVADSASDVVKPDKAGPGWNLKKSIDRAPGYRWPLYQFLKAAHIAGQPCPKAREVLDAWALKPPPDVQVMSDGIKYDNGLGKTKEANLRAMQQAIKGLLK